LAAALLVGTVRCLPAPEAVYPCEEDGTCLASGFYCDEERFCRPLPPEDLDDAGTGGDGDGDDGGSGDGGSTEPDGGLLDEGPDAGADGR